jgi:osmotically-inducible protein OsmY
MRCVSRHSRGFGSGCKKRFGDEAGSAQAHHGHIDRPLPRKNTMKIAQKIATGLFVASLFAVAGCASTATKEGTGEYVDDTVLTTKVKAGIFNEPTLKSMEINVETFKGAVQLSGFVAQPADIAKAGAIARGVKGVKSVKNDIRVK